MENKEYKKAVEAYKNALRNNPADEETRYNLALAKKKKKNKAAAAAAMRTIKRRQREQRPRQ